MSFEKPNDNKLFLELKQTTPNKEEIHILIEQGANINAINNIEESILQITINETEYFDLPLANVQLIIYLRADLEHGTEGFNCLFDACLTQNYTLVELLLKAGANPNCISTTSDHESLLDWAECDRFVEENNGESGAKAMAKIIKLLKKFGAKHFTELSTK